MTRLSDVTVRNPHSQNDPRVSVTIHDQGCKLVLFFADLSADELLEVRVVPGSEPWRLIPNLPSYVQRARAADAHRRDDRAGALRALRELEWRRRGHSDDFYRYVASMYDALVAAGEPHPIKAIAESQPVTISAASRWVKEARQRNLIYSHP